MPFLRNELSNRFLHHFRFLYGNQADLCLKRLRMLIGRYGVGIDPQEECDPWDASTSLLITYGDMVQSPEETPLRILKRFCDGHLAGVFSHIHILPFFPYSSDDGFSVSDYRTVNPDLGSWKEITALREKFRLMFDLVLNHCSKQSAWYQDFKGGISPAFAYFMTASEDADLTGVTRPRTSPLLHRSTTRKGERWLWTTFSADQLDLDFRNPDVLFEFLDILLLYIAKGADIIRLDAIAYLWKEIGSSCIHLPQTHQVVKLLHDLLEVVAPRVKLLTETNVPHRENISYFGKGDEAHMVYQFSLPPLLLHALLRGNGEALTRWAAELGEIPENCTYLNFTASHDGIGVRPLEGLVPIEEIRGLAETVRARGGRVNSRSTPEGGESPYELNITFFSALAQNAAAPTDLDLQRFLCSQLLPLALQGIPALYLHSLTATPNDLEGVERLKHNRAINRRKWQEAELLGLLNHRESPTSRVFQALCRALRLRGEQNAFHPRGSQVVHAMDPRCFVLIRKAPDESETIFALHNLSDETLALPPDPRLAPLDTTAHDDLLNCEKVGGKGIPLAPYQCRWVLVHH